MSKVADRVSSFALIGLHRRKWFRALLSQFTPGPDLHQVQTYTRVMAFASNSTRLLLAAFMLSQQKLVSTIVKCFPELLPFPRLCVRHWAGACWEGSVVVQPSLSLVVVQPSLSG